MTVKKAMLQTYTQAVMVVARRKHILSKPPGSIPDLIEFNKNTAEAIHEHFYTANKNRNPFTRHITPSRDRNGDNEHVRMDFLRAAAREVLGPNTELPKVSDRGQPKFLMLNKQIIQHVLPAYDLSCFAVFANFCANTPTYVQWLRGKQRLTAEEITGLKNELGELRQAAASLAILLENPVISELTNFPQRQKNKLRATLRHISVRKEFGSKIPFSHFIDRVMSANKILRYIYTADLFAHTLKPTVLAQKPNAKPTPRQAATLNQPKALQELATAQLEPLQNQIRRSAPTSSTAHGKTTRRRLPPPESSGQLQMFG